MKFPAPRTLSGTFLPMMLVKSLMGISTIEYPIGRPRPILSVVNSIVNFLIYLGFLNMANLSENTMIHGSVIAANNYRVIAYFCTAFVATSMCLGHIRTKVIMDSKQQLKVLNDRLKILGIPNDYEMLFKNQIIHITVAFAYILILMVLDFTYVGFDLPSEWSRVGFLTTSHYLLIFSFIADGTIVAGIGYLRNRFHRLNTLLAESALGQNRTASVSHDFDDQFGRYFSVISEIHQNNSLAIRTARKQWLLYAIRETRMIHQGFCKTATNMNRAFGVQILLSVALSVYMMTALFYTSYIIATTTSSSLLFDGNWMAKSIPLLWITFYAMKILLIVNVFESTRCEANRTAEVINKLRDTTAYDEDICDEIEIYSLQLLQNPLRFTAHGFFPLNHSLVHGIIGSVTTYLIIMIQMQNIYDSAHVNSTPNSTMLILTNGTD